MPPSSMVSRNSSICPACAVSTRLRFTFAPLVATVSLVILGKVLGEVPLAVAATSPTGPRHFFSWSSVAVSTGAAGVPSMMAT